MCFYKVLVKGWRTQWKKEKDNPQEKKTVSPTKAWKDAHSYFLLKEYMTFLFFNFYWNAVDLQCFRCTAKGFMYVWINTRFFFYILFLYRLLQRIKVLFGYLFYV